MAQSMDNANAGLRGGQINPGHARSASAAIPQVQNMTGSGRSGPASGSIKAQSKKGGAGGASGATKEKKYYHVQISKLADAFENQFFTSI